MGRVFTRQAERKRQDELLSAYLDGQLSAEEQVRLEARLAADPALQADLEALRHTIALVRDLPPVSVPRNFILPRTAARPLPAPPARPRLAWAAPLLTAATAATSLLFVLVLAGNLLLPRMASNQAFAPASAPLPEAEAPQAAMETAPSSQKAAAEETESAYAGAPTPPPPAMEAPAEEPPGADSGEEGHDETAPEESASPTPAPSVEGVAGVSPSEPTATVVTKEWTGTAEATPTDLTEATPAPAADGGAPTEEAAELPAPTPPAVLETNRGSAEPTPGQAAEASPLRTDEEIVKDRQAVPEDERAALLQITPWLVEIALGLITAGLALATTLAWRARRR
jgi:hypothetical protein